MDNSMDVDEVDVQVKNETEQVSTVTASENTEQPEQPNDEDDFGDDNIDIDEDDINFLMSPQPTKTATYSTPTTSTNLNFNSTPFVTSPKPREYVTSINGSQSTNSRFNDKSPEEIVFYSNLTNYYKYLFPTKKYYEWLSYGNVYTDYFPNREFSFTLHPEIYMRFKSFDNEKDFKDSLITYNPKKIDIGAVYNKPPKCRNDPVRGSTFTPKYKELVFDIDMTDYDDIRTCCTGGQICRKCWTFMTIAIKIIDRALRDDFGFKKILWIYSGRRGVHCWVCDERARKLSENARRAIVGYLEVVKGGEQQYRKVRLPNVLHPSLEHAYKIIQEYFPKLILEDMEEIFSREDYYRRLLSIVTEVPDKILIDTKDKIEKIEKEETKLVAKLFYEWGTSGKSAQDKWQELINLVENLDEKLKNQKKSERWNEIKNFKRDVMFQYTYPRLDFNVSLRLNHLLKSPFCIHPGTGRVCVPIDPTDCDNFNPFEVPNLNDLCEEIKEIKKQSGDVSPSDLQKSTSIAPYIKQFSDFVKSLNDEISEMRRLKRDRDEQSLKF